MFVFLLDQCIYNEGCEDTSGKDANSNRASSNSKGQPVTASLQQWHDQNSYSSSSSSLHYTTKVSRVEQKNQRITQEVRQQVSMLPCVRVCSRVCGWVCDVGMYVIYVFVSVAVVIVDLCIQDAWYMSGYV